MGMTLADALSQVDLEPGRLYRERVKCGVAELRVIPDTAPVSDDPPVPDGPPYMTLDFEPPRRPVTVIVATPGDPFPLTPFVVEESDLAPE